MPGPANYFSHPGSLERLSDFFSADQLSRAVWVYGEQLGLKGKICKHWTLNPHPTLIPAIESGWVESVHCFGGELADHIGIEAVYQVCAFLPLIGLLAAFLPNTKRKPA